MLASAATVTSAADVRKSVVIKCVVTDGRGVEGKLETGINDTDTSEKYAISNWALSGEGLDLKDRVGLFWQRSTGDIPRLRIAVDGPVSKTAHLLSITDDTVSAVVLTSDQDTTRMWSFTINFARETVLASGLTSNMTRIKGQVIVLSCKFENNSGVEATAAQAADSWKRFLKNK